MLCLPEEKPDCRQLRWAALGLAALAYILLLVIEPFVYGDTRSLGAVVLGLLGWWAAYPLRGRKRLVGSLLLVVLVGGMWLPFWRMHPAWQGVGFGAAQLTVALAASSWIFALFTDASLVSRRAARAALLAQSLAIGIWLASSWLAWGTGFVFDPIAAWWLWTGVMHALAAWIMQHHTRPRLAAWLGLCTSLMLLLLSWPLTLALHISTVFLP